MIAELKNFLTIERIKESSRPEFEQHMRATEPSANLSTSGNTYVDPAMQAKWLAFAGAEYDADIAW